MEMRIEILFSIAYGKNNGSIQGKDHFTCPDNCIMDDLCPKIKSCYWTMCWNQLQLTPSFLSQKQRLLHYLIITLIVA